MRGERILLEGQLGTMRDLDWGVYPYVTSSSPIPGGASLGAGMPAVRIDRVIGVAKAYTTAVGAGPLPAELLDASGELLRERGVEYGTSTGRPRRCGWYDAVAVRFSVRLAGYSSLALTKLDVLDAFARIPICTGYRDPRSGERWDTIPAADGLYGRLEPIWRSCPAGRPIPPPAAPGPTCPPRREPTSRASRSSPACRSGSSAWGRSATR